MPLKTDTPLIVDPYRVLTSAVGSQCFKPIARRNAEVVEDTCLIQQAELA
jgi:hypothetical protein